MTTPALPAAPVAVVARPQRRDIQGLRALAVGLVVVYHLRPDLLPGGFIGVDVFFVISGFLIIGTLTGELRRTGRIGMRAFYARRIRRLLPAASLVLLATVAATMLLMPVSRWPSIMREVAASALNIQNWALAILSNDYGHATAAASPTQHFWSLAVEEQFYLVIPLVLVLARVRGAFVGVVAVTVASFAFSVVFSIVQHGPAYFVTPTRMWELGVGGLAAMAIHRVRIGRAVRLLLGWSGLGLVSVSSFVLTTNMAFPGYIALLPTLGALAMLVAGVATGPARYETAFLLGLQPFRYIGDISYSLYLWHWPVIVFILEITGGDRLSTDQVLLVVLLSLVFAALSKRFVEDPFRRRPSAIGVVLVAVSVLAASVPWQIASARLDELRAQPRQVADHPGALALDPGAPLPVPQGVPLVPDPAVADKDGPFADQQACHDYDIEKESAAGPACLFGAPDARKTIVLLGDSHAAQYSTALIDFVERNPAWRLKVMVRNGCPFSDVPPFNGVVMLNGCRDKNRAELAAVLDMKPDLVITAGMSRDSYQKDLNWTWKSKQDLADGYQTMLRKLSAAEIPVAVIREVPRPATPTLRCLQRNGSHPEACDTPRAEALRHNEDTLAEAAAWLPGVRTVDLTDNLCTAEACPAVVGNVVVHRDNHLTNTYVHTLSAALAGKLGLK